MAGLLDDSDSDHSLKSVESDEEAFLPSYAGLISSPSKRTELVGPAPLKDMKPKVKPSLLAAIEPSPIPLSLENSPGKVSHSHKKAIKKGKKLAKTMRKLSESIKMRKETAEKLEQFKQKGGVLGLSKELEEEDSIDEDFSDTNRLSSIDSDWTPLTRAPKIDNTDNTPSLPIKPPGHPLFVNPPSLIDELYPPCAEVAPGEGPLNNVERVLLSFETTESLSLVITSQWLGLCYREKSCPLSVWQWLYQIMCRSCDQALSYGAYTNLVDLVSKAKSREDLSSIYCPMHSDVIDVLISLGATRERLSECSSKEDDNVFTPPHSVFANLSRSIQYLRVCVENYPQQYTVAELQRLVRLLAKVALDAHVCQELMSHDITLCIETLIGAIPSLDWACLKVQLSVELATLCQHHHDNLYISRLITGMSPRLSELQISLCRKSIELLLKDKLSSTNELSNSEFAEKVIRYYYHMRSPSYDYEMCYEMYSILAMMALFLNRHHVVWTDSSSEQKFAHDLGGLSDKVRDHSNYPERGAVKDLLIRMKMEFDGQTRTKKQTDSDIRNYYSSN